MGVSRSTNFSMTTTHLGIEVHQAQTPTAAEQVTDLVSIFDAVTTR